VRLFVALDIPDQVRAQIGALVAKLRTASRHARWARIAGAHVTLKFIGEVPPEKVEPIKVALAAIRLSNPIEMKFRNVGFFPNERRPRVFWAGIEAGAELGALAARVEMSLEPLGIAREQRAFSPHLTLARFESPRGTGAGSAWSPPEYLTSLQNAISGAGPLEFGSAVAKEFHLYQSILKPAGAEYTRLATFRFAGGESQ
jgi:RNA 2',3'-cyclic 3'-phosphodiesterase